MSRPTYFVVEQTLTGVEQFALYYDDPPRQSTGEGKIAPRVLYILRLDTLTDAERWLAMPLTELGKWYKRLRDVGKLPASGIK